VPQIEVAFDVDANGIVNVSAKDLATGKEQKITITASSGLSKADVDRLVKEAQSHASEDEKRRQVIEVRNEADAASYSVEKLLEENQSRVPEADRTRIRAAIEAVRKAMAGDDVQAIRQAVEDMQRAAQALAQAAQAGAQQQQGGGPSARGGQPDVAEGEVIDAEPVEH
jgi:molecular chaperone DnaK